MSKRLKISCLTVSFLAFGAGALVVFPTFPEIFFLVVVFDVSVTLGLIRIYTKKAIQGLNQILEEEASGDEDSKDMIDSDFSTLLGDALDESFK